MGSASRTCFLTIYYLEFNFHQSSITERHVMADHELSRCSSTRRQETWSLPKSGDAADECVTIIGIS